MGSGARQSPVGRLLGNNPSGKLDARKEFPNATLADHYDPVAMPPALAKAHAGLDRAVDRCYRSQPFEDDRRRVEYLFALYERLTAPLIPPAKKLRKNLWKRKDGDKEETKGA